jgi:hypothetical protein
MESINNKQMKNSIKAIMASGVLVIATFILTSIMSVNDVVCSNVEALTCEENVTFEEQYAFLRQPGSSSYAYVRTGAEKEGTLCGCDNVNMLEDDGKCLEITVWSN